MKTAQKLLIGLAAFCLLLAVGCTQPVDLSMQRNRIFLMGRLLVGKTCDVRLIWRKTPEDQAPVMVTADLSKIGGAVAQALIEDKNGIWRWTGQVVPDAKGEKIISITAVDSQGLQKKSKKIFSVFNTNKAVGVSAGEEQNLAVRADGTVEAWLWNGENETVVEGLTDVVAVSAGIGYNLALHTNGTVSAWGDACGECFLPDGLDDVVAVETGGRYNYALKADGSVVGWGEYEFSRSPVPEGLSDVAAMACNFSNRCLALRADGTVAAWGIKEFASESITSAVGIAVGKEHYLVLKANGLVEAIGKKQSGVPVRQLIPVRTEKYKAKKQVAAGDFYSMALQQDGTLVLWWQDAGVGPNYVIKGFRNIIAISGNRSDSRVPSGLALKEDGSVIAFIKTILGFAYMTIPKDLE